MTHGRIDFGQAASDYSRWNNTFPDEAFERLGRIGALETSFTALDLGCGSGLATRALAARCALAIGVDPSPALIAEAEAIEIADGRRRNIRYFVAPAEALPAEIGVVDTAVAVRAWHWFDRIRVLAQLHRTLRPGGWLAVMDSVFLPNESEVARRTAELARTFRREGSLAAGSKAGAKALRTGMPAAWFDEWAEAGYEIVDEWQFRYIVTFSHEGWRGRVRALSYVIAMQPHERAALDAKLAEMLTRDFPQEPLEIPHACFGVVLRKGDKPR